MRQRPHLPLLGLSLLLTYPAAAADVRNDRTAVLTVPHTVDVLTIDGEHPPLRKRLGLFSAERGYGLSPGQREIVVRYSEIWPLGDDDHETTRSRPVTLAAEVLPGGKYAVTHEKQQDLREAMAFAEDPVLSIQVLEEGRLPAAAPAASPEPTAPRVEPVVPVTALVRPVENAEPDGFAAAIEPAASPGAISATEMMKYWWEKASASERGAFLDWVHRQD